MQNYQDRMLIAVLARSMKHIASNKSEEKQINAEWNEMKTAVREKEMSENKSTKLEEESLATDR